MKRLSVFLGAMGLAALVSAAEPAGKSTFSLSSEDFQPAGQLAEKQVYGGFGCNGPNISPALTWDNPPEGTKSFALMVFDPDAPTGGGWWHWVVYNIPATVRSLPTGAGDPKKNLMPSGAVQARTDFGITGYGGPCPPPGKPHRYVFKVFALKTPSLEVPADATAALIGFNVNANALAQAELTGMYGR